MAVSSAPASSLFAYADEPKVTERRGSILLDVGEDYEAPGKDDSSNSSSSVYFEV